MAGTSLPDTALCHDLYASKPVTCGGKSSEYMRLCCNNDGRRRNVIWMSCERLVAFKQERLPWWDALNSFTNSRKPVSSSGWAASLRAARISAGMLCESQMAKRVGVILEQT